MSQDPFFILPGVGFISLLYLITKLLTPNACKLT
jgi:hypothetical protein